MCDETSQGSGEGRFVSERNVRVVREGFEALDARDWERFANAHTEDVVVKGYGIIDTEGMDGLRAVFASWVSPFPDLKTRLLDFVSAGEAVFAEIELSGTHSAPLRMPDGTEIPPTGRSFRTVMAAHFKMREGRIAEVHEFINFAHILQQLGLSGAQ